MVYSISTFSCFLESWRRVFFFYTKTWQNFQSLYLFFYLGATNICTLKRIYSHSIMCLWYAALVPDSKWGAERSTQMPIYIYIYRRTLDRRIFFFSWSFLNLRFIEPCIYNVAAIYEYILSEWTRISAIAYCIIALLQHTLSWLIFSSAWYLHSEESVRPNIKLSQS